MQGSKAVINFVEQQDFQEKVKLLLRHNSAGSYWISTSHGDSFLALIDVLREKNYLSATPIPLSQVEWNHNQKPLCFNLTDGNTVGVRYANLIPSENLPTQFLPPSTGCEYCIIEVDDPTFVKLATAAVNFETGMMLDELFYSEQQRLIDERIIDIYKEQRVSLLF